MEEPMKILIFILMTFSISLYANIVKPSEDSLEQDLKYSHTMDDQVSESDSQLENKEREVASDAEKATKESKIKFWSY
jgi:hypothetical protein